MLYSLLLIIALIVVFRLYSKKTKGLSPEEKKKQFRMWVLIAAAIGVAVLAFSKGNVIAGALASLVALFSRIRPFLRYAPLLKPLFTKEANTKTDTESNTKPQVSMDKTQAAAILGVGVDANEDEVIAAHKRLIQKVHPDKGGSDALAVQINTAKKVLLS